MKKIILLLICLFPIIVNASENKWIEAKIENIEKTQEEYKNTWEISKKILNYYDTLAFILIILWWLFSYFWIQIFSIKDKYNNEISKLNESIKINSFLSEIEKFRINCKNFISLSDWDWQSSVFLDFDHYIAQIWRNLFSYYEKLKEIWEVDNYLLVEDFIAIWDANYHNKDFESAISFYNKALEKSKYNPKLYYNIWFSFLENKIKFSVKNEDKEIESFKKAINYWEFDYKNYVWFAISLSNIENIDLELIKSNLESAIKYWNNEARNMIKQYYSAWYFDKVKDKISNYL